MHHIVVIGGGPGGYSAAFEAAAHGARVTLVERERLGGTCLNWGCIPTKTMLRTAHIVRDVAHAERYGLQAMAPAAVDVAALRARKQSVVDELVGQVEQSAKRLKVQVLYGEGRIIAPGTVEVATAPSDDNPAGVVTLDADATIIATGSVPMALPFIDHSLERVWTSDDAVSIREIPAEIIIMGGGVIGVEFATAYAAFGSKVTVVELAPTLIPGNDKRVTRAMATALQEQGVELRLGASVTAVAQSADGARVTATLEGGEVLEADVLLSAVGRMPNTRGFGFEEAGIQYDRAAIVVDEYYRTAVPHTYAIGDAIGGMMLAHAAEAEGEAAALNALADLDGVGAAHTVPRDLIPACIYTFPEVAVVGRTAEGLKRDGVASVSAIAKFTGNGKALGEGEADGFVQLVAQPDTGRILGCQMVGPHVVELIHEVSLAMAAGVTAAELGGTSGIVWSHPTVSEVVKVAARMAADKAAKG